MTDNFGLRMSKLREELALLKREKKEQQRAAKIQSTWVKCSKHFPTSDVLRVIVWAGGEMIPCWHADGNFYSYDGTWLYVEKNRVEGVTHWMPKDWMYVEEWPFYGPGLRNRLVYYWRVAIAGVEVVTRDFRPKGWSKNAQISKKVVYFKNDRTGEIRMGLPEQFPASQGFHKVVCNSAHEAEVWSERLRQYNMSKENRVNEARERVEGAIRDEIRRNMHHVMANSRNNINREYVRRYLDKMDRIPSHAVREEYLHSEAYEKGR